MELFYGILLLFLGYLASGFLWKSKKDRFLEAESDRCLKRFCEVDEKWNSRGRVYTKGLAVVEKDEKKQFVKQAKLCDIGILD